MRLNNGSVLLKVAALTYQIPTILLCCESQFHLLDVFPEVFLIAVPILLQFPENGQRFLVLAKLME